MMVVRMVTSSSPRQQGIKEGPERDLVNFPRPQRLQNPPKCTFGFIPEHYFQFFYPKTGVSGGWAFGTGFLVYVLSKEIWVLEHEFWNGVSFFIILIYMVKKFGPQVSEYLSKAQMEELEMLNSGKKAEMEAAKSGIEFEKKAQWQAEGQSMLFQAKRENVALQVEAAYRERLVTVYNEVKRRLDYQVAKQEVERAVQQKHMVNWIVSRVQKSITSDQENENIKACIANLKALAAKA
jgi:F-type H+-transporting ATPase subunit b